MRIAASIEIAARAEDVWEMIGPGFARVGEWATAVPHSVEVEHSRDDTAPDAPCAGRVCETTVKGFDKITETITAYDALRLTLTYRASGFPGFVRDATNTWLVEEVGPGRSRVSLEGRVVVAGVGHLLSPMLAWNMRRIGRESLDDLKHYVEQGVASPRKRRQLAKRAARV